MKKSGIVYGAIAIAVLLSAKPAGADDNSRLADRIANSFKFVKSFETVMVQTDSDNRPLAAETVVFIAPDRLSAHLSANKVTADFVFVGDAGFRRDNAEPYQKMSLRPSIVQSIRHTPNIGVDAELPDAKTADGTYGVFQTSALMLPMLSMKGLPSRPNALICMYDRKTYLLAKCSGSHYEQLFGKYDDPNNLVETPKDVK